MDDNRPCLFNALTLKKICEQVLGKTHTKYFFLWSTNKVCLPPPHPDLSGLYFFRPFFSFNEKVSGPTTKTTFIFVCFVPS